MNVLNSHAFLSNNYHLNVGVSAYNRKNEYNGIRSLLICIRLGCCTLFLYYNAHIEESQWDLYCYFSYKILMW